MWRQYEAHDLSEYAEDGHNYMIVNAEEYTEEFDEWQEKQEWEEQEKAIQSFSQQDLTVQGADLLRQMQNMHAKIARLRIKTEKALHEANKFKRRYKRKSQTDPSLLCRKIDEVEQLKAQLAAERLRQQEPNEAERKIAELVLDNQRLSREVALLKKRLYTQQMLNEALEKSERKISKNKKVRARLRQSVVEAEKAKVAASEEITERARKAGKAKQSPYEKAGTIAAVNELLEKHQALLGQHGGKAALCKMIRDSIAERAIPAYREPSEKTVMKWINNFQNRKSTS